MFPLLQNLSVSVSVMAWAGALGLGLAYVTALWLLPDLRPQVSSDWRTQGT